MSHSSKALPIPGVLDVVAVISNPIRYASRWYHYRAFEKHMLDSGVRLTTVELVQGNRQFEITSSSNPRHVQLRSYDEIWHKENLINIGISRLPSDWEYVAWVDADITFNRPDWAYETLHALQHWDIVQPFSHSINMGPNYQPIFDTIHGQFDPRHKTVISWIYGWFNQLHRVDQDSGKLYSKSRIATTYDDPADPQPSFVNPKDPKHQAYVWHSGFAWAARRSAIKTLGGLLDWAILGSADRHMAEMMTTMRQRNGKLSPGYIKALDLYNEKVAKLNGNFGYVDGLVTHHWHGRLVNRFYLDRWKLLYQHQFNPLTDLHRDENGLWQLTDKKPGLRDDIRRYFRARSEDSIDV